MAPLIPNLGFTPRTIFFQEKITSICLPGRWVGTEDGLDAVEKMKCLAAGRNITTVPRSSNP